MKEIILRKMVENMPTKKDTEKSSATLNAVKEFFPHLVNIVKEVNECKKIEGQYNLAIHAIQKKKEAWEKALNERVKERGNYQNSIREDIYATDNINDKIALYDKWLECINSPLVNPEEI